MKHIRTFENYRITKNREDIIKESVLQVNDVYKVKTMVDIPQSLINAYIKRVKDNTGKNLRQFFGDVDIAEEIVKYINTNFIEAENIPADFLMGGGQASTEQDGQTSETEPQATVEVEPEVEAEAPVTKEEPAQEEAPAEEPKEEVELPSDEDGFEEPTKSENEEPSDEEKSDEDEETSDEDEETSDEEGTEDDSLLI